MIALIMAGGSGTRFWPQSRKHMPKQFLQVVGNKSMIQLTVDRLLPIVPIQDIYIVTAASQVSLVTEHLPDLPRDNIIIEPFGMNTAPCIALSITYLKQRYADDTSLVVLPADHVIRDTAAFVQSLQNAELPASTGHLVTFGIIPDFPATGYGYIEAGNESSPGVHNVTRFKEKPDLETAKSFLASGNYYWNSGMFYWKIGTIWKAFNDYMPLVVSLLNKIIDTWKTQSYAAEIDAIYAQMPRIPIDIGIMEPAAKRAVLPVNIGWSDVGSWKALAEISAVDADGNSSSMFGISLASEGNFVNTRKFTALIGVENLCIVETEDAILITTKDRAEDVKKVVDYLTAQDLQDLL